MIKKCQEDTLKLSFLLNFPCISTAEFFSEQVCKKNCPNNKKKQQQPTHSNMNYGFGHNFFNLFSDVFCIFWLNLPSIWKSSCKTHIFTFSNAYHCIANTYCHVCSFQILLPWNLNFHRFSASSALTFDQSQFL